MSKTDTELPERLRDAGATDLERRLLRAASREEPSRALAERMAGAIGIAMPITGSALGEAAKPGTRAASETAATPGSLAPWISGAFVAAVVAGAIVVTLSAGTPPLPSRAVAAPSLTPVAASLPTPVSAPLAVDLPPKTPDETAPSVAASPETERGSGPVSSDIAEQIALIDAARVALAGGSAERALTGVRQYQTRYPKGTFRPEAAAIKIEALVNLGRADEARALAERFLAAHGPSPLADRVARLAGLNRR
jgi:hypothetical protein